jgi:iron complex outermembrane receptor protein
MFSDLLTRNMPPVAGIVLGTLAAAPALAQDNAVRSATDAFGERVGVEQAGLYSETQVRGFNLADSGNYRIDGAYFSLGSPLDDTVLAGVGVRVGVNATSLAYPAPSGVVNYRLRQAGPADELRLGGGLRDFGTKVVQADGSLRAGKLSITGGVLWRPKLRYAQGYVGRALSVGAVAAWQISDDQRLRVFGSLNRRRYDGDYIVVPTEAAVPPSLRPLHQYSPSWAKSKAANINFGALYDAKIGGFTVDLTAFHSVFDIKRIDYTLLFADAAGHASATVFRTPHIPIRSDSAEARVGRQFATGNFSHLLTLSVRGRRTTTDLASDQVIPLGTFDLRHGDPPSPPEPVWSGTRGQDKVEQVSASAGYGLAWRDRVQLRFALHRTRYDKRVLSVEGARSKRVLVSTFYNASAVVSVTRKTAIFGSWVTGLEETGTAPTNATNHNEVLPPAEAKQFELGVRHNITPKLTFIAALFDITKPTQGFRGDGSFGEVGKVRHRGIEGSIAGQLDSKTNVVVGVVAFQPKVTGPLVDAGIVGVHEAGISNVVANVNLERQIRDGWSLDAGLSHLGGRWANTANTFRTPAITTLSLGTRYRFKLAGRSAELRLLGSNLTGTKGYSVAPSGLFSPIAPRTVRAILTVKAK